MDWWNFKQATGAILGVILCGVCLIDLLKFGQACDCKCDCSPPIGINSDPYEMRYCMPWEICWPSDFKIKRFRNSLTGSVVLPADPPYNNLSRVKSLFVKKRPGLIVLVATNADVQKSIEFARKHRIRISILSCGHDYTGRSTADGSLQINFVNMTTVSVNMDDQRSKTGYSVWAQPGAELEKVYKETDKHGKQVVAGNCGTVCVAGLMMGGGVSAIMPSYGLTVDNVIEFTMALYDGKIVRATAEGLDTLRGDNVVDHSWDNSLFWAVRGGGGGGLGVLLSVTFVMHDSPEVMVTYKALYAIGLHENNNEVGKAVGNFLLTFLPTLPKEWGCALYIGQTLGFDTLLPESVRNSTNSKYAVIVSCVHNGPWETVQFDAIQPLVDFMPQYQVVAAFANHTDYDRTVDVEEYRYNDIFGGFIHVSRLGSLSRVSDFFTREAVLSPVDNTFEWCMLGLMGGEIRSFSAQSAAISYNFRTADFFARCIVEGVTPDANEQAVRNRADYLDRRLGEFRNGVYFNDGAYNLKYWWNEFWGENYGRLMDIKRKYDPENVFSCHHCLTLHKYY